MYKGSRLPFCCHCKVVRVKRGEALYCSGKCYSDSGHRSETGKLNGGKSKINYWKRFSSVFQRKYGSLDKIEQMKLLINIGMRRAYRERYKKAIKEKYGKSEVLRHDKENGGDSYQKES